MQHSMNTLGCTQMVVLFALVEATFKSNPRPLTVNVHYRVYCHIIYHVVKKQEAGSSVTIRE